jgi:hypothetical protein
MTVHASVIGRKIHAGGVQSRVCTGATRRIRGTPEERARAVEVLLSAFSDHMTGVNLRHSGFSRAY